MKRILQIVGGMNRAGAETMLLNIYKHIDHTKFQFDFIYFTKEKCDYDDELIALGGHIYRVNEGSVIKRAYRVFKIIKNKGPYVAVHSHTNYNSFMHHIPALLAGVKKRITHSHCSNSHYSNSFKGRLYLQISRVMNKLVSNCYLACGDKAGGFLFPTVNQEEIMVIPNALDLNEFINPIINGNNTLRANLAIDEATPLIVQIGRMSKVKNFEFTIQFAKYLFDKGKPYHFVFVGTGELQEELHQLTKENNLLDIIHFLGVRGDIAKILYESDCLILPSLHEGFPVVLVETQATGICSLISDQVSKEVDLGLGLIKFCSLDKPNVEWEHKLDECISQKSVEKEKIEQVLIDKGFSIQTSVKKIEYIYDN